jgi:hypothetical protein
MTNEPAVAKHPTMVTIRAVVERPLSADGEGLDVAVTSELVVVV